MDSTKKLQSFDVVAVLLDEVQFSDINLISKHLKSHQLGSTEIIYKIYKEPKKSEKGQSLLVTYNDFSLKGEVINPGLNDFIKKDFDLMINYYDKDVTVLKYVNLLSNAKMKIGFSVLNCTVNQLDINVPIKESQTFFSELKKYLTLIKK